MPGERDEMRYLALGVGVVIPPWNFSLAILAGLATAYIPGGDDEAEEMLDFEGNDLTSDTVRWTRNKAVLEQAPELGLGSPTIGWTKSALRSCARYASRTSASTAGRTPARLSYTRT